MERLGGLARDKERLARLVVFTFEYALRYAMVPGRVENWGVIIDLRNVFKVISPLHVASMTATAVSIATALEKVYCNRMGWIKIVNMPGSSLLARAINATIPGDSKEKVSFPTDAAAGLMEHFEPNQLERRYGGAAPDTEPGETYPYRFFPGATGKVGEPGPAAEGGDGPESGGLSMHESVGLAFHEGLLWDESSAESGARWMEAERPCSLAPHAAEYLSKKAGEQVLACRSMPRWKELHAGSKQLPQSV